MASKRSPHLIGVRAQDFHEGLREVSGLPARDVYFRKTLRIGKAAALATHLRGFNVVNNPESLITMASLLGIGPDELPKIIEELRILEFVRGVKTGPDDVITRIELAIPELRSIYEDLGGRLLDLKPGEHEMAAIDLLEATIRGPKPETVTLHALGLAPTDQDIVRDVLSAGSLVDSFQGSQGPILYTPLMVEQDPKPLIKLSERFPEDDVVKAFETVKNLQGIPEAEITASSNDALRAAVESGVLQPVTLDLPGRPRSRFYFTPRGGLAPEKRIILDKARALLAGVRAGQRYPTSTRIRRPAALLRAIRDRGSLAPHSDAATQYGLIVSKGMGTLVRSGSRWEFRLKKTPENVAAVDLAIEMLETGEMSTTGLDLEARELVSVTGNYRGPLPTRSRAKKEGRASRATLTDVLEKMTNLVRGVDA